MKYNIETKTEFDARVLTVYKSIAKAEFLDDEEDASIVDTWTDDQVITFVETKLYQHLIQSMRQHDLIAANAASQSSYVEIK